jgi:bifunctional non-homologous end joining protein LigD
LTTLVRLTFTLDQGKILLPKMPTRKKSKRNRLHPAAIEAALPASLDPMLPTLVHKPFSGQEWLFEPKWDGWRATCFIKEGESRFVSRKHNSLNERFPQLNHVTEAIKANTAVLDGEIVALDKDGLPRFDALRSRRTGVAIVFYAFDLLYLDGFDLSRCPLVKRKELLRSILPKDNTGRVRFTDHVSGSGERLFQKLEALQLEGMVMKRKDSVYAFMRCRDWLKVRTSAGRATIQKRIENWR